MKPVLQTTAAMALLLVLAMNLPIQTATAEDPKTRGKAGDVLTPLAMGNTWVYGAEGDEFITTDRIEGVVLFDGKPWHLLRSYEREAGEPEAKNTDLEMDMWIAMIDGHETDAFIEVEDESGSIKLTEVTPYFRYPATLGESYKPIKEDPTIVLTVTALHEKVTTKAGEFDCVVYKETSTDDPEYSASLYVAPGVGVVKIISVEDGETYTSTLHSYSFPNDK